MLKKEKLSRGRGLKIKQTRFGNPREREELALSFLNCFSQGHIYQVWAELEAENLGLAPGKCCYFQGREPNKQYPAPQKKKKMQFC